MLALARQPRIRYLDLDLDEHEENCAATIVECELPGFSEQILGFDVYRQRRREAIAAAKWLLAAACLGATVAALWLVKAWG